MFMSLLTQMFARKKTPQPPVPCPHLALVPHWDSVEDMGKRESITSYLCTACGETFARAKAQAYLG
jgi:hypothetical protein